MRKTLTALAAIVLLPAGAALAGEDCNVPRTQWQPRDAAMKMAEENGWTVRDFEIDDGCYELEVRDGTGRKFEVKLDPATLQVVEMDAEDDDDSRSARNPAPAGSVAPPQNGLFGNGAAPQVQVN